MGEFSFLRADVTLKRANIVEGDPISLLIPKELHTKKSSDVAA